MNKQPHFSPSDWTRFTPTRMYVDPQTGEVQVRAGFRHKKTGKVRDWWRPASEQEIREWEAKDE